MADGTTLGAAVGSGDKIATDDLGATGKAQWVKLMDGTDGGTATIPGDATNGLRVDVNNAAVADGGALPAKGVQVGGTDGSVFQVLSTDSAGRLNTNVNGTVPVSDGGGSLTVDGAVTADTELTTADLDTGAGTDTRAVVGLVIAKSGGAANISNTDPLPISDAGGTISIDDGAGSITVDGTVGVSGTVTVDTELPAAAALADAAANPTAPAVGAFGLLWNGATWDRAPGSAAGGLTTNLKQLNGTTIATNSGNKDAGTQRVVIATDQVQLTNALKVDGSAVTQPVSDGGGSITVDAPVGTPVFVTPTPSTTGGWSKIKYAAQTTTVQTPKGTTANFGGFYYYNPNTSAATVQVFDAATATTITLGTTVPDMIFTIPASSGAVVEVGGGVNMANGIKLACTTTATGSTAPTTGLDLTVFFK